MRYIFHTKIAKRSSAAVNVTVHYVPIIPYHNWFITKFVYNSAADLKMSDLQGDAQFDGLTILEALKATRELDVSLKGGACTHMT